MTTIVQRVCLERGGVEGGLAPTNLVVTDSSGQQYLKLQLSHPLLVRLICRDEAALFQATKNASLSGSDQLKALKGKLQSAIEQELLKHENSEDKALFEEGAAAPKKDKGKVRKVKPSQCFETVEIEVDGTQVLCLVPPNGRFQEIHALLQEAMLEAVFCYLAKDCKETLENMVKRSYKKRKENP